MSESSDPASSNTPLAPALHSPPLPAPPPPHPTSPFQIPLPPSPTTVVRPLVYPRKSTERASHAKRGSIAFPTIDHLQHHFTKISIAGNKHEEGPRTPPPFDVSSSSSTSTSTGPSSFAPHLRPLSYRDLPPSPAQPRPQSKPAFPPSSTTPVTALKPEAVRHIQTMEHIFRLGVQEEDDGSGELMEELGEPVDLRELLKAAITTVRAVRSFVMALPDEAVPSPALPSPSVTPSPSPSPVSTPPPSSFLPHQHFSVPSRPSTLSSGGRPASFGSRSVSGPTSRPNPLIQSTRKLALDLLGILRLAEERHRLPDSPNHVSHSQQASVSSSSSQPSSPPLITPTPLPLGWKEAQHASEEAKLSWEDRLASYDPDVTLSKLNKEREAARSYLDEIDVLLFGGRVGRTRGWCISRGDAASGLGRRRSFTPQTVSEYSMISETTDGGEREEDGGEEEDWLDHSKPLATRLTSLFYALLPNELTSSLDLSSSLATLSDGRLLCHAHNAAVKRSKKPFGFITSHIHDALELRTFQKIENIGQFAGALKLRWSIAICGPSANPPAHSIIFDPSRVAKKEEGWEEMLERVLVLWLNGMAEEVAHDISRSSSF